MCMRSSTKKHFLGTQTQLCFTTIKNKYTGTDLQKYRSMLCRGSYISQGQFLHSFMDMGIWHKQGEFFLNLAAIMIGFPLLIQYHHIHEALGLNTFKKCNCPCACHQTCACQIKLVLVLFVLYSEYLNFVIRYLFQFDLVHQFIDFFLFFLHNAHVQKICSHSNV